mmetsp:Transcript_26172/g.67674  ORF Transcript_26172/g.67674 Transcript_26172/m.67674 type:complete len:547 (-) Transcript_26172:242-1882(-)
MDRTRTGLASAAKRLRGTCVFVVVVVCATLLLTAAASETGEVCQWYGGDVEACGLGMAAYLQQAARNAIIPNEVAHLYLQALLQCSQAAGEESCPSTCVWREDRCQTHLAQLRQSLFQYCGMDYPIIAASSTARCAAAARQKDCPPGSCAWDAAAGVCGLSRAQSEALRFVSTPLQEVKLLDAGLCGAMTPGECMSPCAEAAGGDGRCHLSPEAVKRAVLPVELPASMALSRQPRAEMSRDGLRFELQHAECHQRPRRFCSGRCQFSAARQSCGASPAYLQAIDSPPGSWEIAVALTDIECSWRAKDDASACAATDVNTTLALAAGVLTEQPCAYDHEAERCGVSAAAGEKFVLATSQVNHAFGAINVQNAACQELGNAAACASQERCVWRGGGCTVAEHFKMTRFANSSSCADVVRYLTVCEAAGGDGACRRLASAGCRWSKQLGACQPTAGGLLSLASGGANSRLGSQMLNSHQICSKRTQRRCQTPAAPLAGGLGHAAAADTGQGPGSGLMPPTAGAQRSASGDSVVRLAATAVSLCACWILL